MLSIQTLWWSGWFERPNIMQFVFDTLRDSLFLLRHSTPGRSSVAGPAHKFPGFGAAVIYYILAGHPRSRCPARLRGHKGSGLWKVWTVPCPALPCPALPCPALPCPALPCPALPCPALPCPPLPCPPLPSPPLPSPPLPSPPLPPSRVPNLIKLGPAVWPKLQPAEARECSAALAISEWTRRLFAMLINARRKMFFENVELRELCFESGLMNGPVHDLKGKWSECHRVRNAKRPREGSNSRTVPYYYIDSLHKY